MPVTEVIFPTLHGKVPDAEGTLAGWLVRDGARVRAGQLLAEVRVQRAAGQIAAPTDGILHLRVQQGDLVQQGAVVATLE